MGRLQEAATVYRDRWLEYIRETAGQPPYWARRGYGLSIGQKYLVRFLLLAGPIKKAAEVTDVLVSSLLEEVQDTTVPPAEWLCRQPSWGENRPISSWPPPLVPSLSGVGEPRHPHTTDER